MADRHKITGEINTAIDGAVEGFNKSIPSIEKDLSKKITHIIRDLDTSTTGNVKTSVKNLRKMREVEREMAKAFESDAYLKEVKDFTGSYEQVRALETNYFKSVLTNFSEPSIMGEITRQSIKEVTEALTGSNITANVINPVNNLVRQGIESGMGWDDMRSSISGFLQGAEGTKGALDRYTTTITNDSLNTYSRTYENYIADREGIDWFEYIGREVVDTREFCEHLDKYKWFKRSDIPNLIKGRIKNYKTGKTKSVAIYKKTGKPRGMKANTTSANFVQLTGGWNCGHHAYPVPTELVPDNIKNGGEATSIDEPITSTSEFVPAKSIGEAEQRIRDLGVKKVGISGVSNDEMNYYLQGIEAELKNPNAKLETLQIFNNKKYEYNGNYSFTAKTMRFNAYYGRQLNKNPNTGYPAKIVKLKKGLESREKSMSLYESRLGQSKSMDKSLKKDIKRNSAMTRQIKTEIEYLESKVANGEKQLPFTYSSTFDTSKERMLATTHHEFGHYWDDVTPHDVKFDKSKAITEYAKSNKEEYIAEMYAKYKVTGSTKDYPEDLIEFFNKTK